MKFATSLLAATAIALTAAPAAAQMRALNDPVTPHPDPESLFTSDDPVEHRNAQAALHIMRELLQCNQWDRAGEWLTDRYIQHNPLAASGLDGVVYYFTEIAQVQRVDDCGELTSPIVEVVAEGDMVVVLIQREIPYADNPEETYTTTWFDAWRFVDGKADVHWDPATLPVAPPQSAAPADEHSDRAAIDDLMWRYVRAIDRWDADAYASVFTEDGSFMGTTGRDNLHAMVNNLASNRPEDAPTLQHVMSNQNIEFTGPDSAIVHYYWQTVTAGSPGGATPQVLAAGVGRDEVVRVDGEWLIANRDVTPEDG